MSKYTLLIISTTPIIIMGMMSIIIAYKLKRIGKRKLVGRFGLWLLAFWGIIFLQPIYNYLIQQGLTDSDPLSLFDVVLITAILLLLLFTTKAHGKISHLEDRLNRLHRQLSINESTIYKKK
jgi:uncharacterized membrane protein YciS (DUF1049 family)